MMAAGCISTAAQAQTPSPASTDLGKVSAATSGITTFRFAPSTGAVTVVSGSGQRISTTAVRFLVSIACTNNNYCRNQNMKVVVGSIGTPSGRLGLLTNFTFANNTANLISGPTGTNPITFTIGPIGNNNAVNFYIGADAPLYGDDQTSKPTGAANSSINVTTSQTNGNGAINAGTAVTATVSRNLSIGPTASLNFGTIYRPTSGSSTISIPASTGVRSISGTGAGGYIAPTPSRAAFTISGEGGQTVSISVPSSISLIKGTTTLTVLTSNTGQGTQILSNSSGSGGSFSFYIGGAFAITNTTPTGAYSGTYTVTVSYN